MFGRMAGVVGLVVTSATVPFVVGCDDGDNRQSEVEGIVSEWAAGWVEDEPDRVLALYGEAGTYSDASYPFVLEGKSRISEMVRGLLSVTDFTKSEPTSIEHDDDGAVVKWIWAGSYRGQEFTMNAQTTFVLDGMSITSSTDSYFRPDAPWTGQHLGGTEPWEVVAEFADSVWDGDLDGMEALFDADVVRTLFTPDSDFYEQLVGRDAVMRAYEGEVGTSGGQGPAVATSAEAVTVEGGIVTQHEPELTYVTEVSADGLIVRLEQLERG